MSQSAHRALTPFFMCIVACTFPACQSTVESPRVASDAGGDTSRPTASDASSRGDADAASVCALPTCGEPSCSVGTPAGGSLVTLATAQTLALALSGSLLYWTDPASIADVSVSGGTVSTLASGSFGSLWLDIDEGFAYTTQDTTGGNASIVRLPALGGTLTTLVVAGGHAELSVPALDGTNLYWGAGDTLLTMPIAGGPVVTLASGQGSDVVEVAVDATNVYWYEAVHEPGNVLACPTHGGAITTLATDVEEPSNIVSDGTSVYWASSYSGAVVRTPIGGGSVTTLYVDKEAQAYVGPTQTSLVGIGGIALDDANVYWTNTVCTHSVMKVAKTGGDPVTLVTGQPGPLAIAVDAKSVYWTNNGAIVKLTPK